MKDTLSLLVAPICILCSGLVGGAFSTPQQSIQIVMLSLVATMVAFMIYMLWKFFQRESCSEKSKITLEKDNEAALFFVVEEKDFQQKSLQVFLNQRPSRELLYTVTKKKKSLPTRDAIKKARVSLQSTIRRGLKRLKGISNKSNKHRCEVAVIERVMVESEMLDLKFAKARTKLWRTFRKKSVRKIFVGISEDSRNHLAKLEKIIIYLEQGYD